MRKDPTKPNNIRTKKARKARRRKLEIQRMRSVGFTPEAESSKLGTATKSVARRDCQSSLSSTESSYSARRKENTDGDLGEGGGSSGCKSGSLVYGHVSMMGRRREMEDAVTVAPLGWLAGKYSFFAVYDGHGGARVAKECSEKMHKSLEKLVEKARTTQREEKDFVWEKVMVECFSIMDKELLEEDRSADEAEQRGNEMAAERMMGSTAAAVVVGKEEVVVANCGDSRVVLCRSGVAVPLSRDHKPQPDRADEKERIEAAGGRVVNWNGWRVQGVLATSRSLGDHCLKPYVTSEPEVTVVRRSDSDEFLIIATDGLFDVVGNEIACGLVKRYLGGRIGRQYPEASRASEAAAAIAELAIAKGSNDNISVIVVQLK